MIAPSASTPVTQQELERTKAIAQAAQAAGDRALRIALGLTF